MVVALAHKLVAQAIIDIEQVVGVLSGVLQELWPQWPTGVGSGVQRQGYMHACIPCAPVGQLVLLVGSHAAIVLEQPCQGVARHVQHPSGLGVER